MGWQWRNFFISAVFRHFVGQALRNVCRSDISRRHFLNEIAMVPDIFLKQLIQFYSNNATNIHHLTTHSMTCYLQNGDRIASTDMWRHFTLCIMATLRSRCGHYIFVPFLLQRVLRLGSITARHSGSGRQPNFAALNRGCHLSLAGRSSRWALSHILVCIFILRDRHPYSGLFSRTTWVSRHEKG